jgi:glycosyltransferase involved in cell wall biosynthesis
MRSVLLSHPHAAAVANEAAAALASGGILARYATGAAWPESSTSRAFGWAASRRPALLNRVVRGVDRRQLWSLPAVELAARACARATLGRIRPYDAVFWAHDRAVASAFWPVDIDCVYAYEDAAAATFERARRRDAARIWDLPAPHHRSRERVWREEPSRWPGVVAGPLPVEPPWKRARKDRELRLATGVVVASAYTLSTLRESGYEGAALVVPYGFPVGSFPAKVDRRDRPFTVLAVKGTPYLLEAWRVAGVEGRLRLVGAMRLGKAFMERYAGRFEHVPYVPRARLSAEYQGADVLVFPSLGDGFGLVMQEAMCSGTPVVATRCSGGPECIVEDGREGWLVPDRSVEALVEVIRRAAADRERLREMGRAARRRAEAWTWAEAGTALVRAVERLSTC